MTFTATKTTTEKKSLGLASATELVSPSNSYSSIAFSFSSLRVTHGTFQYVCELVREDLQKQQTRMRGPISVEERVGLALWRLATSNSYRSCGLQFGYGKLSAKYICSEFERALLRMKDQFIKFPLTRQEITEKG